MPLTDYLTLGRSGLRVSPLCLGAMTFGNEWGFGASPEDSCTIIDAYIHQGGNFIDTANIYNHGHSETILGDHLARFTWELSGRYRTCRQVIFRLGGLSE